jgi:hypothetical protein
MRRRVELYWKRLTSEAASDRGISLMGCVDSVMMQKEGLNTETRRYENADVV